jgi:hypothetical protein
MAAAPIITDLPIERPGESGSHFTEPWLEPFLVKHSSWYHRHLTKAGRRESKSNSSRNSSVTTTYTEAPQRKASVDEEEQWRRVEEEYKETSSESERGKRVVEV